MFFLLSGLSFSLRTQQPNRATNLQLLLCGFELPLLDLLAAVVERFDLAAHLVRLPLDLVNAQRNVLAVLLRNDVMQQCEVLECLCLWARGCTHTWMPLLLLLLFGGGGC